MSEVEALVPLAERPLAPVEHQESRSETIWFNPNDEPTVLDLYVGVDPAACKRKVKSGQKLTWEERTGSQRWVIKGKSERAMPSDFDQAIQQMQCLEMECLQKPFDCKDLKHRKRIVGGLGPHLVHKGMQHRATLAPALDAALAQAELAKKTIAEAAIREAESKAAMTTLQRQLEEAQAAIAERDAKLAAVPAHEHEPAAHAPHAGRKAPPKPSAPIT